MTWYKDLEFEENPFTIKPTGDYELFFEGKNVYNEVIKAMNKGRNIVIKGPFGSGKTSILKKIINEFGGKRKIYYYNAFSSSNPINFDLILANAGNFFSRLFKTKSKDVILFIDEAQHLPEKSILKISKYLGLNFRSVVFVSSKSDYEVPEKIKQRIKLHINLGEFTINDAYRIIEDRLGKDQDLIEEDEVKELFDKSKTPREFLLNCEDFCKNQFE